MIRIYAKHEPYNDGHLQKVRRDMELAGPPTIRAIEFKNELFALEGSHRLFLAHEEGLVPRIFIFDPDIQEDERDEYFLRIKETLPFYDFDFVLKLEEATFKMIQEIND